jgi:putative nucleotidyltransferase with HDIG domain
VTTSTVRPEPEDTDALPLEYAWLKGTELSAPVLPTVAHRVIDLASDPDVSLSTIAGLVSKDQVIAARVLGLANSAASSPLQMISTVAEAVVRLGTSAVRNVVITVCLTSRMQDPAVYGARGKDMVDHSIGTAYLARMIAERARTHADEAFLCGLLHDIGKLVILKQAHSYQKRTGKSVDPAIVELALLERHAAIGAQTLRQWKLPGSLDEPVLHHHDYQAAREHLKPAAVVYAANILAHRFGFGCPALDVDVLADPVAKELGLNAEWVEEVAARAPGLVEVAGRILS